MPCTNPVQAYAGRKPNDNGRFPVAFRLCDGWADRPLDLPCGKCPGCLQDRAGEWSVRAYHESLMHERNCFVTLTFTDEFLPSAADGVKYELQCLFKRLRYHEARFRYAAVVERGETSKRLHAHVLFFGVDFMGGAEEISPGKWFSPVINEAWGNGHALVMPMHTDAIFYTMGYQLKNLECPDTRFMMSRRPRIGHGWLEKYWEDCLKGFVTVDGRKVSVPRVYLEGSHAVELESVKDKRRAYIEAMSPEERWLKSSRRRGKEANIIQGAKRHRSSV